MLGSRLVLAVSDPWEDIGGWWLVAGGIKRPYTSCMGYVQR